MPFLWGDKEAKNKNAKKNRKPSPTNQLFTMGLARSPQKENGGSIRCLRPIYRLIEKAPLPVSFHRKLKAGMTVEAAVVLPLFLFFVLNLSCAIELIRLHGNLQLALWETGSQLAVYGHGLEDNAVASMFSYFYVKNQMIRYVGEDYLNNSPLSEGAKGLIPWESKIFTSEDEMDLIITYQVSPWSSLAGFTSFRMANRYYGHIWNGYDISDSGEESRLQSDVVYMAENGKVYHENRNCTHLTLSIQETTWEEAIHKTNQWGRSYTPCEKCSPQEETVILYITDEGERYHSDRNCSGLKRTVFSVPRNRVSGYRACSRCG